MSYENADGRVKIIAGALSVGQAFHRSEDKGTQKRVVSLGKAWTEGATDENRYGLIGSPGGSQPWVDRYRVQYAYYVEEEIPETT